MLLVRTNPIHAGLQRGHYSPTADYTHANAVYGCISLHHANLLHRVFCIAELQRCNVHVCVLLQGINSLSRILVAARIHRELPETNSTAQSDCVTVC